MERVAINIPMIMFKIKFTEGINKCMILYHIIMIKLKINMNIEDLLKENMKINLNIQKKTVITKKTNINMLKILNMRRIINQNTIKIIMGTQIHMKSMIIMRNTPINNRKKKTLMKLLQN